MEVNKGGSATGEPIHPKARCRPEAGAYLQRAASAAFNPAELPAGSRPPHVLSIGPSHPSFRSGNRQSAEAQWRENHFAALPYVEVPAFIYALRKDEADDVTSRLAFELLILTGIAPP